jgi:predicted Zn finger-like uncharacterized protein
MSLITSCPACGTMFRVVPDQLKISEGWVRCGHCAEIFDASAYLTDESAIELLRGGEEATRPVDLATRPADLATRPADLGTRPAELSTRPDDLATRPADLADLVSGPGGLAAPPPSPRRTPQELAAGANARAAAARQAARGDESSASSYFGSDSQSLEPSPLDAPFVFRASDLVPDAESSVLPPEPPSSGFAPSGFAPSQQPLAASAPEAEVSFVRQARRKAFWRRPLVRIALAFVSLMLAFAFLLQVAYQDRDRLAQAEPELRPALERMCELLQCTLGVPRQIESVVIESSGFNRVRDDTYRLTFTLRNAANVQVAAPSMELTVTDAQDQPIARRVLTPAEIGAPGNALPPAADWSGTVGIVLTVSPATRVAGYRLLAFYP